MSGESSQALVVYAVLVLFLMIGAAGIGIMSMMLDNQDKELTTPHDYDVDGGTYKDVLASGTGRSEYLNESQREYLYHFVTSLDGGTEVFDVICGSDKVPVGSIYAKGDAETVGGAECTWWSYDPGHISCRFAIDGKMVVHKYVVTASDGSWSFSAVLRG